DQKGIASEVRLIAQRARKAWGLLARRHKLALIGAASIMALTSASNTAVALLLGRLVDSIQTGVEQHADPSGLFQAALWVLGIIAAVYVVREALNIVRRYFVEYACIG